MTSPRPNLRLVHPLDRSRFAQYASPSRAPVDWLTLAIWGGVIGVSLSVYYGLLLLLWWCCA